MTGSELLLLLSERGVELWVEGDRLCFRAPKGALTPELRTLLAEHKEDLLTQLRQAPPIVAPLSYNQRSLWFLWQLTENSAAYNVAFTAVIATDVDPAALKSAFQVLTDRHPALRTTFTTENGVPIQQIHPHRQVDFEGVDATAWDDLTLRDRVTAAYRRPFNLETGPLLRVTLFSQSPQHHVLLLTIHHIVADGWSLWVLLDELRVLYPLQSTGASHSLSRLTTTYPDYVQWQAEILADAQGQKLTDYWQQQLEGELPILDLPTDRTRPALQTDRGGSHPLVLDRELTQSLKALAKAQGVTLYMLLLAAFQTLLHRYSRQDDLLVGSPVFGRNKPEFANLVGDFVNMLPLRADLSGNPTFTELLVRVRQMVLGALEHQDYPFALLVEQMGGQRDASRSPLFQVTFDLQRLQSFGELADLFVPGATTARVNLGGLILEPFPMAQQEGQFDLTMQLVEVNDTLPGVLKYNADLFDAATIARMIGHFQTLLQSLLADPQQRLSELPLLTPVERQQLLVEWNPAGMAASPHQCLHHLFEAQVARTPDAIAVTCGDQHLTYQQLNQRANQVAAHLQHLGVGPESLVGLCVDRSLDLVVGIVAILKAGGAYVPLDLMYPAERLAYILQDAQISILLTQTALISQLPPHALTIVDLDDPAGVLAGQSTVNPESTVTPENLAYVIYTSGSTGTPKGVLVTHTNGSRLFSATADWYQFNAQDVWTLFHSYAFDFSVWELWGALLYGGRLVVVPFDISRDAQAFYQLLGRERVTVLNQTPSAFRQLIQAEQALGTEQALHLRYVIFGGEALDLQSLKPWFDRHGDRQPQLVNMYGITETTVHVTYRPLTRADLDNPTSGIGVPIPDLQLYVLDPSQQPVPIGVPGEIYVGGQGVARGYLNRPELTAERFLPHPFVTTTAARLYRSGDLARYRANGELEYLGRLDHQVKIRGFRIELGEIESLLMRHPAVGQVLVKVDDNGQDDKRLVAYVVPTPGQSLTTEDLRRSLKEQVPTYMVPAAFVLLEAFPLTANGKIDQRALPAPDLADRRSLAGVFVPPTTPAEVALAGIWSEVLGIEQVGIEDNFFDLGGHSLLATQVVSRIREEFQIDLPLRALFEAPTIHGLSLLLETHPQVQATQDLDPIQPIPRDQPIPLSFAQERLWFLGQLEGENSTYNISGAIRIEGSLQISVLEQAITEIVRRHEGLRTAFPSVNGVPVQRIIPPAPVALALINLQELGEPERSTELQRLFAQETHRLFDLEQGPLLQLSLVQLELESSVLLLTMHHIIADGWSLGVFIQELSTLYTAFIKGQPSPLPELPIQYADFTIWQRQWLQGETLATQLSYWKQQLASAPPLLELPTDHPRPPVQSFQGHTETFMLDAPLTQQLHRLSQTMGATLYMTVLAVYVTLLARYSGQDDICVGSPIANRNRRETQSLIGLLLNTLVMRVRLQADFSFADLLNQVRKTALDAYAHQDVPFEQLIETLHPERSLSHSLWFQVMFIVQNMPLQALELPGLTLTPLDAQHEAAKFDQTLTLVEVDQQIKCYLEYNTDLFEPATMQRLIGHFQTLLAAIVENPHQKLAQLPVLTPPERQQLLLDWNQSALEFQPLGTCMHALFEAQVARSPAAIAVQFLEVQLTYQALNERANQLAHHLISLGVGPDQLVGICVERSPDLIVAVLGTLKAGGAYVPLDPAYPSDRIGYILDDAQISVLLTQAPLRSKLPAQTAPVVCLDADWATIATQPTHNPTGIVTTENLAYVIYTSGSTGKPKGVMIEHQALVNFTQAARQVYGFHDRDRVLQFASISFDAAAEELYPCLITGGTLVLRTDEMIRSAATFIQLCQDWQLTVLDLPTAYWFQLTADLESQGLVLPSSLRLVIIGGEQVLPSQVAVWQQLQGHLPALVNTYGPTEATIVATVYDIPTGSQSLQAIPIGRPLEHVQTYVLDPMLQPVPIGIPGELCIGGMALARGYLNQPDLSTEKFVPNPFQAGRLYRTGDRVRYLPDGNLEFLGRIDQQVKIRGFRIELGEIEAILLQQPIVQQAAVEVFGDRPDDRRLVAYLVPEPQQEFSLDAVRQALKEKLPAYMLPSAFMQLEAIPLTPNGKIDRRALPVPVPGDSAPASGTFVPPGTPTEVALVRIWADVLKLDQVSTQDDFFDLGGHSLLATQVIARVQGTFGVELPLRALFEASTIQSLAGLIVTQQLEQADNDELERLLAEVDALSDEAVQRMLSES
ncbi:hypothetical protein BST81_00820 [Leptolyngbya sp. 'hensonii']|uniref:non-ribosomal peptide synthetase n=1 Tax=Leptolyngbya sp. 'hensonii' TaxID=1922337 RepID=UPI00094FE392|nr:non-ribosomal peptide synthetase [Leptolyngbya sp. 'hensonii']OLP20313.1 hypothetical protein BST81_00820 [Leptolyngbya sp. 'hensonii']